MDTPKLNFEFKFGLRAKYKIDGKAYIEGFPFVLEPI